MPQRSRTHLGNASKAKAWCNSMPSFRGTRPRMVLLRRRGYAHGVRLEQKPLQEGSPKIVLVGEMLVPDECLQVARKREPLEFVSVLTGFRFKKYMVVSTCLEKINLQIRADTQNQLLLRSEMTDQEKEFICAAGRGKDTLATRLIKSKMKSEYLYATMVSLMR